MKKIILASLLMSILLLANIALAASTEPLIQATFSANPATATPGNDGYIQMTLKNAGTAAASRIKISFVSMDSNIVSSGTWIGDLSPLGAGDSVTSLFKFTVSDKAPSGLYPVTFYIDYGADSTSRTINPNAIITVQSPAALEVISIRPSSLNAGENASLVLELANIGKDAINNIRLTWQASSDLILPLGSDNRIFIPAINAGQTISVLTNVVVSPSIAPNLYSLSIKMEYYDRTGMKQNITSTAGIMVGGLTDFDVSTQDSTATSATFAIANKGANTAYSVIAKIPEQENFRTTGASAIILGNLNAGDYTLAIFQVMPRSNVSAGRGRDINLEISYTDALGIRRTVQKEVTLSSFGAVSNAPGTITGGGMVRTMGNSSQTQGNNSLAYIGIGAAGIIAIVAFFKFRKREKK